jgi:hypothetical protein
VIGDETLPPADAADAPRALGPVDIRIECSATVTHPDGTTD